MKTRFVFVTAGLKAQLDDGKTKIDLEEGRALELDTTKSYSVTATAPNYDDYRKKIEFGDDAELTIRLALDRSKVAVAPPASTGAPVGTSPPSPPSAPPSEEVGTLFVKTLPPSNCVVNGTPRGHTPLTIRLPPGVTNVTCLTKDGDETLKKSGSIVVKAGEKATLILKLRD